MRLMPSDCFSIFSELNPDLTQSAWDEAWDSMGIEDQRRIIQSFTISNRPLHKRLIYRAIVGSLNLLPFKARRVLIEMSKVIRRFKHSPQAPPDLFRYGDSPAYLLSQRLGVKCSKSAVLLTYDLDKGDCIDYLPVGLAMLKERNIKATFNILTGGDYQITPDLIDLITGEGHTIGLHGHRHDIDFGNRSQEHIRQALTKAQNLFPGNSDGFRSPALSISPQLYKILEQDSFLYDSSVVVSHPFYQGCGVPYPYKIPGTNVVEYPVLFQDNVFFSDYDLGDGRALEISKKAMDQCMSDKGVAVLNLHLCIECEHEKYHRGLLDYIVEKQYPALTIDEHYRTTYTACAS